MSGPRDHYEENGGGPTAPVPPRVYDPGRLLGDVMRLLAERGLPAVISTARLGAAVHACEELLRCVGIAPVRPIPLTALSDPANVDLREVPTDVRTNVLVQGVREVHSDGTLSEPRTVRARFADEADAPTEGGDPCE